RRSASRTCGCGTCRRIAARSAWSRADRRCPVPVTVDHPNDSGSIRPECGGAQASANADPQQRHLAGSPRVREWRRAGHVRQALRSSARARLDASVVAELALCKTCGLEPLALRRARPLAIELGELWRHIVVQVAVRFDPDRGCFLGHIAAAEALDTL